MTRTNLRNSKQKILFRILSHNLSSIIFARNNNCLGSTNVEFRCDVIYVALKNMKLHRNSFWLSFGLFCSGKNRWNSRLLTISGNKKLSLHRIKLGRRFFYNVYRTVRMFLIWCFHLKWDVDATKNGGATSWLSSENYGLSEVTSRLCYVMQTVEN